MRSRRRFFKDWRQNGLSQDPGRDFPCCDLSYLRDIGLARQDLVRDQAAQGLGGLVRLKPFRDQLAKALRAENVARRPQRYVGHCEEHAT